MAATRIGRRLLKIAPVLLAAAVAALAAGPDAPSLAKTGAARVPLEQRVGLRPGLQLAAMRTAIAAAPQTFSGYSADCKATTPVLAFVEGRTMAGNFRDQQSGCYVWLNLAHASLLTAQEICKLTLHEMGHLGGMEHSTDPADVMYSPFEAQPIPAPCVSPLPTGSASRAAN
jgi:matrixin